MKIFPVLLLFIRFAYIHCAFDRTFSHLRLPVNADVQIKTAQGVLRRLLGTEKSELFSLSISETSKFSKDGFNIFKSNSDEKVSVSGPNGLSIVWGVHYYLKNYCNIHVSWDGDQLNIPEDLPSVNITIQSVDTIRFYQNACTPSYSFVWWDWDRWEREIDWMALNGINLALAFTAQEAIWQTVYDDLGLNSSEFTGPAFLAWNRMGNLRNFGNGLTSNWHEDQIALQHKILNRMRDLGIVPVLPAFCGIVPRSFKDSYPLSDLTLVSHWNTFSDEYCCPYFLNPSDELFPIVSRVFLREYINEFGTNHIYSCDAYNENTPASGDPVYLSKISKSIYEGMKLYDPKAVWMVQGWMFIHPFWASKERVKGFLSGVPKGRMVILDLQSDLTPQYERLDSYFGHPFIWCTLLNFGGQLGMYGHLNRINTEVLNGRTFKDSTMVGIGIVPEGIDQNYLMYEYTLESAFRTELSNLTEWVSQYARRRYGVFNYDMNDAWIILKNTAYNYRPEFLWKEGANNMELSQLNFGEHISKNILVGMPSLKMHEPTWYNRTKIYDVWLKFLQGTHNTSLITSELFNHDLIDVTRQTIQFAISSLYFKVVESYNNNDAESLTDNSDTFLDILDELDRILKTGKKFLLGKWLEDAKKCAKNRNESINYEFNARNQITLWGPNGEIRDYAAKQWSGLIADYYKKRWDIFFSDLKNSLMEGMPFKPSVTKKKIFMTVELPFVHDTNVYPSAPVQDTIAVVQDFAQNWKDKLKDIFENFSTSNKYEVFTSRSKDRAP